MTDIPTEIPANIREFNEIAGVILGTLYQAFPVARDLDPNWIAQSLKHDRADKLRSGRTFNDVMIHGAAWLLSERFITTRGGDPWDGAVLTAKALHAMNGPGQLEATLGTEIVKAAEEGQQSKVVELIGNFLGNFVGGFTKSMTG